MLNRVECSRGKPNKSSKINTLSKSNLDGSIKLNRLNGLMKFDSAMRSLSGLRVLPQHVNVQSYRFSIFDVLNRLTSQTKHVAN